MGVPIDVWARTMQAYPLKFRFGNIKGFYSNRRAALRCDETFAAKAYEDTLAALREYYEENREEADPDGTYSCAAEYASEMASDDFDLTEYVDSYLVNSPDEAAAKYPITEVLDCACSEGVDVADVVFLCPSCCQQPVWREVPTKGCQESAIIHNLRHCGLCGGGLLFDGKAGLLKTLADLDIDLFPFRVFSTFDAYADLCVEFGLAAPLDDFEEPFESAQLMTHKGVVIYMCTRVMDELLRATVEASVKATSTDNLV